MKKTHSRPLDIFRDRLACPTCNGPLTEVETELRCSAGCPTARIDASGSCWFGTLSAEEVHSDFLNSLKEKVKVRFPHLFTRITRWFSPVYWDGMPPQFLNRFDFQKDLVIDVGSGVYRIHPGIVSVDGGSYPEVDVHCDAEHLPFADNSVDGVMSLALLEHVQHPEKIVAEIYRVLRPGGSVFCVVPFMQAIHASPHDFRRWTSHGLRLLFSDFEVNEVRTEAGPTSGAIWVLQCYLAILLSFGSRRLYWMIYIASHALCPLKVLDRFLQHHPMADTVA